MDFSTDWIPDSALVAAGDRQTALLGKSPLADLFDAKCKTELETDMSAFGIILGVIMVIVPTISIVPSLTKPYNRKSTEGMSPASLLLTNYQQTLLVANFICLKWEQLAKCQGDMLGCQPSLLSFYSAVCAWALLFLQYICIVWYPNPPEAKQMNRVLWYVQLGSCGVVIIGCLTWVSMHRCSEDDVLRYAGILFGLISSALMVVRFAPQLYMTCKFRSAGSISYITYGFLGAGGFIGTYFSAFQSKDPWSTWFPVFVGNCMQTIILFTCLYFDWVKPKVEHVIQTFALSQVVAEQEQLSASLADDLPLADNRAGDVKGKAQEVGV